VLKGLLTFDFRASALDRFCLGFTEKQESVQAKADFAA
jgi:hypothetical protein